MVSSRLRRHKPNAQSGFKHWPSLLHAGLQSTPHCEGLQDTQVSETMQQNTHCWHTQQLMPEIQQLDIRASSTSTCTLHGYQLQAVLALLPPHTSQTTVGGGSFACMPSFACRVGCYCLPVLHARCCHHFPQTTIRLCCTASPLPP
jgi:hypothetical protein